MFESLYMDNVRTAGEILYTFAGRVFIRGRNGVGKSTVLEGLCFAVTGRDSSGEACPTHLIARGEKSMRVRAKLDEWVITRSLTLKKNSSLTLERPGVPAFSLSQSDLTKALSLVDLDVYLAATVPGYFMGMTPAKRFSLLSSILPKIDRVSYLSEASGFTPGAVSVMCGDFARGIPSYHNFSAHRIDLQKKRAHIEGQIEEIVRTGTQNMLPPRIPEELSLLDSAVRYHDEMNDYTLAYHKFVTDRNHRDYVLLENERRSTRRCEVERLLSAPVHGQQDTICPIDHSVLDALKKEYLPLPVKPPMTTLPSGDRCSSCGQAVGSALRGKVREENEAKFKAYEEEYLRVSKSNLIVEQKTQEEGLRLQKLVEQNSRVIASRQQRNAVDESLRRELLSQALALSPVPEMPVEPLRPAQPESLQRAGIGPYKKDIAHLQSVVDGYNKEVGVYEKAQSYRVEGEAMIARLSGESASLSAEILRYDKFEHALRNLPVAEVLAQQDSLKLENYSMDFSDGFNVRSSAGTPYDCMSSGEKMMLNVVLCFKIQSFMETQPRWCFVDDSELINSTDMVERVTPENMQLFFVKVDPEEEKLVYNVM